MGILGKGRQARKMQTATSMITRPMNLRGTEIDYAERSGAAFLPTIESHVIVPFMEAIISGLFAGLAVGVIVFLIANTVNGFIDIRGFGLWVQVQGSFIVAIITGFIVAWRGWHSHLDDYKSLLWYTEFANGPEPQIENKQTIKGEVKVNNNWVYSNLPFDRDNPQALVDFAKGVSSGATPFSERGAGRYGYSVQRFTELRDNFIKGRLAYWKDDKNKKLGVGLNAGGYTLLKKVANNPPPANYEPSEDWGMSPEIVQK